MIVKNEREVIRRSLDSIKKHINYWVIVDTGSTDGTQEIIRDYMLDVPGELHERPWVNFSHNRNEALSLAKNKADYVLFIDADEKFVFSDEDVFKKLNKDFYHILCQYPEGTVYHRRLLVNNHLDWKWEGILHETICSPQARSWEVLPGVLNLITMEGYRSKDPGKYLKDAQVLEEALKEDPTNCRYAFYLAQSYRDAGEPFLALKNYEKRARMGGWEEEVFRALYEVGLLQETMNMAPDLIIQSYWKAYQYRPSRAEPLYRLACLYRNKRNYLLGYIISKYALSIPLPNEISAVERQVYDYALLLEFGHNAFVLGKIGEVKTACQELLSRPNVPIDVRLSVEQNLTYVNSLIFK